MISGLSFEEKQEPVARGSLEPFIRRLVMLACLTLTACATNVPSNSPLENPSAVSYKFEAWISAQGRARRTELQQAPSDEARKVIEKSQENLVVMSFSGGGTRAAALAAAVLDNLGAYRNRVAIISSTSGGSVAAGYIGAEGTDSVSHFEKKFLRHDHMGDLAPRLLPRFLSGGNRSLVFARHLDTQLFASDVSFGELAARWDKNRPFLILNASDMNSGNNFVFTQESFNALCSDLSAFPLSEAIAASAAVPVAMSPITLANYWNKPNCALANDSFYDDYFNRAYDERYADLPNFVAARHLHSLRHANDAEPAASSSPKPYRRPKFLHLLDGGLSDNLASRALLSTFSGETIRQLRTLGVRRILLVQVNARSEGLDDDLDSSADTPGIFKMIKTVILNPIDVTTALSAYIGKEYWAQLVAYEETRATKDDEKLSFFPVEIDFDLLDRSDFDLQIRAKATPTSWTLSEAQIDDVMTAGRNLLSSHPCFLAFRNEAENRSIAGDTKCSFIPISRIHGLADGARPPIPPAKAAAAPAPAAPKPTGEKITVAADALFDFNKAVLRPEGKAKLDELFSKAKAIKLEVILAVGHTDRIGGDAYNQSLSEKRAAAVKEYLIAKGIEASRVYTEGKGETQPVTGDKCKGMAKTKALIDCLQPDRRVDIEVIGTK